MGPILFGPQLTSGEVRAKFVRIRTNLMGILGEILFGLRNQPHLLYSGVLPRLPTKLCHFGLHGLILPAGEALGTCLSRPTIELPDGTIGTATHSLGAPQWVTSLHSSTNVCTRLPIARDHRWSPNRRGTRLPSPYLPLRSPGRNAQSFDRCSGVHNLCLFPQLSSVTPLEMHRDAPPSRIFHSFLFNARRVVSEVRGIRRPLRR